MKKLSIEEKAQRYDEAIKKAKSKIKNDKDHVLYENDFIEIFPELKESEDERVRKELIEFVKSRGGFKQEYIAWLEKQGEQKPVEWDILSAKKGDMLSNGTIVLIVDSIEEFEGRPIINSWYFADSEKFYGKGTSECDRWEVDGFRTATKIECNYLLKKIADAEYEWDADRKELKKIEQKPAWSEEDENMFKSLKTLLNNSSCYSCTEGSDKILSWLKSLSPQKQWKPSIAQLNALNIVSKGNAPAIVSLYKDLKKLREE